MIIRFSVPDVPYSQIEADTDAYQYEDIVRCALDFRAAFLNAFPQNAPQRSQARSENGNGARAPQQESAPPAPAQTRSGKVWGFCPDHPEVEAVPSAERYQEYDDVDGERLPAKFYCPGNKNGTGKNHALWRSRLVMPY